MDISEVFFDEDIHEHSESALRILFPFKIGEIVEEDKENDFQLKRNSNENAKGYPLVSSDSLKYENFTIDLNKGMIAQVYNLSKVDYEDLIDHPIHLPYCRLYDHPVMEFITRNKWYNIAIIWGTVILYLLYNGICYNYEEPSVFKNYVWREGLHFSYLYVFITILFGMAFWTKFEYLLHRFLLHCNTWLPDNRFLLHVHFLFHGIHHTIPMDP